jgi:hypothetical protein
MKQMVDAITAISDAVHSISDQLTSSTTLIESTVKKTEGAVANAKSMKSSASDVHQVVEMIDDISEKIKLVSLNASIEAARAGESGRGFSIVAIEVKELASQAAQANAMIRDRISLFQKQTNEVIGSLDALMHAVGQISDFRNSVSSATVAQTTMIGTIETQTQSIAEELHSRDATRMIDMSQSLVQLIVRNLYERTADVRWWAVDETVHRVLDGLSEKQIERIDFDRLRNILSANDENTRQSKSWLPLSGNKDTVLASLQHASKRLATINKFYSVYLNLVLVAPNGVVVSSSQPSKYPHVLGADVSKRAFFRDAMATKNGTEYAVEDVLFDPLHDNRSVAVYATAVRRGGVEDAAPVGVLGVYFDWEEQSRVIVRDEPIFSTEEWARSRVLLLDKNLRVIAASDGKGLLSTYPLHHKSLSKGNYACDDGRVVAYAKTIGYQEFDGVGLYGVIEQL